MLCIFWDICLMSMFISTSFFISQRILLFWSTSNLFIIIFVCCLDFSTYIFFLFSRNIYPYREKIIRLSIIKTNIMKNIQTYTLDIFRSITTESESSPTHLDTFITVSLSNIDHLSVPLQIMFIILPVQKFSIVLAFPLKNLIKYSFIIAFSMPICGIHHT